MTTTHLNLFRRISSARSAAFVSATALATLSGCSIQSFEYLQRGNANSGGTTTTEGGALSGGASSGGASSDGAGTAGAAQGGANQGGANQGGANQGGTFSGGAGGASAGASSIGGAASHGGSAGATESGGGAAGTGGCPAYTGVTGLLLTPPSNGFETESGWTTVTGHSTSVTRVVAPASACEGSTYLTCDGPTRMDGWDGPAVEMLAYITPGHKYAIGLVARYNATNAPTGAKVMGMTVSLSCSDASVVSTYPRLQQKTVFLSWTRFTGQFVATLAGCTDLSRLVAYVETESTEKAFSIDVDDFVLYDITTP